MCMKTNMRLIKREINFFFLKFADIKFFFSFLIQFACSILEFWNFSLNSIQNLHLWRFCGVERVAVNCCGVDDTVMSVEMVIAPENREELCNLHGFNDEASRSEVMKIRTA